MSTNTTSIRRPRPRKPIRTVPVSQSAITSRENALRILRDFYMEAKKEIKGATTVSLNSNSQITNLSFVCEGFDLQLNFSEGRKAV